MKNKLLVTLTLTGCFLCGNMFAADNLGTGFISNVTPVNGECVQSTTNGGGNQFWDIQAGGTYIVTLSGVTDCASQGQDTTIGVLVKNSAGGNFCATATQQSVGVYTFLIPLTTQCQTMPIVYCTTNCAENTGLFTQDDIAGAPGGNLGHLRTSTFDAGCTNPVADNTCNGGVTPTPTPPPTASITACKFYDKNANGSKDVGESYLAGWPFGICPRDGAPENQTQITPGSGCVTWTNLAVPNDYTVTEANALESNWFHSPDPLPPPLIVNGSSVIVFPASGGNETRTFGNYCTSPSGGLTLGFWSNKNGNKILTGNANGTGQTLLGPVVTLLNSCQLVNANGSLHTFTNSYSAFRSWLLGATATNMAYMLSAQLVALKLDVTYAVSPNPAVDGNAFDLCSHMTINGLIAAACDSLAAAGGNYTIQGDPTRLGEEMLKNCIDAINNNGAVVPTTPCPHTFASPTPCP